MSNFVTYNAEGLTTPCARKFAGKAHQRLLLQIRIYPRLQFLAIKGALDGTLANVDKCALESQLLPLLRPILRPILIHIGHGDIHDHLITEDTFDSEAT